LTVEDAHVVSDLGGVLTMEQFDVTDEVFIVQGGSVPRFQNWTMTETQENDDCWRVAELAAQLLTLLQ
jgi:hypothetical protein